MPNGLIGGRMGDDDEPVDDDPRKGLPVKNETKTFREEQREIAKKQREDEAKKNKDR
jgi:hypothetical protein